MKVVINGDFGGFGLSDKAVERCIELGMKLTTYNKVGNYTDESAHFVKVKGRSIGGDSYYSTEGYGTGRNKFRSDPRLVQAVEELGNEASGFCATVKVIDIPFQDCQGWEITEYDGYESVEETHGSWS